MDFIRTIFFDPIFNALIWLYNIFGDIGVAIIIITFAVRILVAPFSAKAFKAQRRMQALQPELKKLQAKHKDDRELLAKEMMAFYQKEGINPAASCLPTLVQIPFLIALFFVFKDAIEGQQFSSLYSFVQNPGHVDTMFLGVLDLSDVGFKPANVIFGVLAAGLMYMQSRMLMSGGQAAPGMNKQLMLLFPALTLVFSLTLFAALPLYWAASTLFVIGQQYYITRKMPLAVAKVEATHDWNIANPDDPVNGAAQQSKSDKEPKQIGGTTKKGKGGATVTVRQRKGK